MKQMNKILFVCMGNICRSPAAEGVMKEKVKQHGLEDFFHIDSAGLYAWHQGEMADARMRKHASRRGYNLTSRSRPVTREDFEQFDLIIGMDEDNIVFLQAKAYGVNALHKVRLMTDFCKEHKVNSVPDPYYGGSSGFELVLDLLEDACEGLLEELKKEEDH